MKLGAISARYLGFFTIGVLCAGCGSKGAVALGARIDDASIAAEPVALGVKLTGAFNLVLDLGPAAPEATTVSLGTFAIKNDAGAILDGLPLGASETFPVSVAIGESKVVRMTLDGSELAEADLLTSICGGDLWYSGTVNDTLSDGKPTVATSSKLVATCP